LSHAEPTTQQGKRNERGTVFEKEDVGSGREVVGKVWEKCGICVGGSPRVTCDLAYKEGFQTQVVTTSLGAGNFAAETTTK
jgi:hypothetical protein